MRRHHHAAVGNATHGARNLDRRDRQRLAKTHRAQRGTVILVTLLDNAKALAGKIDARTVSNAPFVHVRGKIVRADLMPDQYKANIG